MIPERPVENPPVRNLKCRSTTHKRERKGRTVGKAGFPQQGREQGLRLNELAKVEPSSQQRHHEGTNAEHHPHHVNASLEKLAEQVKALAANQAALQNSIAQMSSRGGIPISVVEKKALSTSSSCRRRERDVANIGAAEKACFSDHVFFGHNHI